MKRLLIIIGLMCITLIGKTATNDQLIDPASGEQVTNAVEILPPEVQAVKQILDSGAFGPWGIVAGAGLTLVFGSYFAYKKRKKTLPPTNENK